MRNAVEVSARTALVAAVKRLAGDLGDRARSFQELRGVTSREPLSPLPDGEPCISCSDPRELERVIVFHAGMYWNVDLRALHDALYGAPDPKVVSITFIFEEGAVFCSRDAMRPAVDSGVWPTE